MHQALPFLFQHSLLLQARKYLSHRSQDHRLLRREPYCPGSELHYFLPCSVPHRGGCNEILLDGEQSMAKNNVVLIPGNMVHGAKVGDLGCDAIDIFWPARADYAEKEKARLDAYHVIIPEDAKLDLFIDGTKTKPGLTFSEGPKWMNGKVYFSNMYFDQKWTGSPKKSSTVELDPNGKI